MRLVLHRSKTATGMVLVAMVFAVGLYIAPRTHVAVQALPERLDDSEFWTLIDDFSEAGGYFRSDNFVSNESTFQYVIPELIRRTKPGGAYLGVGPDQNFTYIAALRPKLAFITDIRRQNMMLHLMYKALFELSEDRRQFLSQLFSRPIPAGLSRKATTQELFEAFQSDPATPPDPATAERNLDAILEHLQLRHHFDLSLDDTKSIEYIYNAFVSAGPEIRYSYPQYAWRRFPSYAELMLEKDQDGDEGESRSYMATEENFQLIKKMQSENRIVPLVGDFAGDKTLKSVARFLKDHGATVTAFYTSNVEFYLFQSDDWKKFFNNVAAMPLDDESTFIRAYFNNYGYRFQNQGSPSRSVQLLDSMRGLVTAFGHDRIHGYFDIIQRSPSP